MKRIRLNSDRILLNATALADQLTTQMPSAFLCDVDRAFLAHTLGTHALLVKLFNFGSATTDLIELLDPTLRDTLFEFDTLNRKLYDISTSSTSLNALSIEKLRIVKLKEELQSVVGTSVNSHTCFANNNKARENIYAYVLMRYRERGFQHYPRRLKLVIPAATDQYISDLIEQGIIKVAAPHKFQY